MSRPDDPVPKPRRFYEAAGVVPHPGGYGVALDGRIAKTPAGGRLVVAVESLAQRLADEWDAQAEVIDPAAMPLSRLAFTALDRATQAREALAEEVARYAGFDLLCYFAEAPAALVERQSSAWEPILTWAEQALNLRLIRAAGIAPLAQPPETLDRVRELAVELDPFWLTGVVFAAGLFGSAILALAVQRRRLTALEAFELSRVDEAYQEARWGVDAEALERTERLRGEAEVVQAWFEALQD